MKQDQKLAVAGEPIADRPDGNSNVRTILKKIFNFYKEHNAFRELREDSRLNYQAPKYIPTEAQVEAGEPPKDPSDLSSNVKSTLRKLFLYYKEQDAFKEIREETLLEYQVANYIDFQQAEAGEWEVLRLRACKKCGQDGHPVKKCPVTEKIAHQFTQCYKCKKYGHFGSDCQIEYCGKCKKSGHLFGYCADMQCSRCFESGHKTGFCMNADKRTCEVCGEVGHVSGKSCPHYKLSRFTAPWSNLPVRPPKHAFAKKEESGKAADASSAAVDVDAGLTGEAVETVVAEGNWEGEGANDVDDADGSDSKPVASEWA